MDREGVRRDRRFAIDPIAEACAMQIGIANACDVLYRELYTARAAHPAILEHLREKVVLP